MGESVQLSGGGAVDAVTRVYKAQYCGWAWRDGGGAADQKKAQQNARVIVVEVKRVWGTATPTVTTGDRIKAVQACLARSARKVSGQSANTLFTSFNQHLDTAAWCGKKHLLELIEREAEKEDDDDDEDEQESEGKGKRKRKEKHKEHKEHKKRRRGDDEEAGDGDGEDEQGSDDEDDEDDGGGGGGGGGKGKGKRKRKEEHKEHKEQEEDGWIGSRPAYVISTGDTVTMAAGRNPRNPNQFLYKDVPLGRGDGEAWPDPRGAVVVVYNGANHFNGVCPAGHLKPLSELPLPIQASPLLREWLADHAVTLWPATGRGYCGYESWSVSAALAGRGDYKLT